MESNPDTTNYTYIAVDVAKENLQVQLAGERSRQLPNTIQGVASLIDTAKALQKQSGVAIAIIYEASGGYERLLRRLLAQACLGQTRVSADKVRAHAKSLGIKAKTDPIDAALLLHFAVEKKVVPQEVEELRVESLRALLDRRSQLVEACAKEKTRRQNSEPSLLDSIERSIDFFQSEIAAIEQQIRQSISADDYLRPRCEAIRAIDGVGEVSAWSVLAYLPELPSLKRNRASALAGLAPFNDDSGTKEGPRHIWGGRAKLRRVLYMTAINAVRYNDHIQAYHRRMIEKGKPRKCALVAVMRKLLLHIRSTLITHETSFA